MPTLSYDVATVLRYFAATTRHCFVDAHATPATPAGFADARQRQEITDADFFFFIRHCFMMSRLLRDFTARYDFDGRCRRYADTPIIIRAPLTNGFIREAPRDAAMLTLVTL